MCCAESRRRLTIMHIVMLMLMRMVLLMLSMSVLLVRMTHFLQHQLTKMMILMSPQPHYHRQQHHPRCVARATIPNTSNINITIRVASTSCSLCSAPQTSAPCYHSHINSPATDCVFSGYALLSDSPRWLPPWGGPNFHPLRKGDGVGPLRF